MERFSGKETDEQQAAKLNIAFTTIEHQVKNLLLPKFSPRDDPRAKAAKLNDAFRMISRALSSYVPHSQFVEGGIDDRKLNYELLAVQRAIK